MTEIGTAGREAEGGDEQLIRRYLSNREVASLLGMSRSRLYRIKRLLENERGFPLPVPRLGYDPLAIKRWQDGQIDQGEP